LNYRGFLGSGLPAQFPVLENVLEVQSHVVRAHIKELGHLALGKPDGLFLCPEPDLAASVLGRVENQAVHRIKADSRRSFTSMAPRRWSAMLQRVFPSCFWLVLVMEIESTAIGGEMMTLHGVLWVKIEAAEEKQASATFLL
jgi:hypothetical protein